MIFEAQIYEKLSKELDIKNKMAIPKIVKVVINVGIGQTKTNPKFIEAATNTLLAITGQKPAERKARKAVAGFKIRQGDKVGLMVTLRGKKMKDFIIKLANIVLPRMRDFRGLRLSGFDNKGNYNLGLTEQIIFSEISHEKADILHGLSISIVTNAKTSEKAKLLLEAWGLPFEKSPSTTLPRPGSGQVGTSQDKLFEKEKNG